MAKSTILDQSKKFTKKDMINSRNATAAQDMGKETFKLSACAVLEKEDEDGEPKTVGVLVTNQGTFTTISSSIVDTIYELIDLETDGDELDSMEYKIEKKKSKGGRDFLTMTIL